MESLEKIVNKVKVYNNDQAFLKETYEKSPFYTARYCAGAYLHTANRVPEDKIKEWESELGTAVCSKKEVDDTKIIYPGGIPESFSVKKVILDQEKILFHVKDAGELYKLTGRERLKKLLEQVYKGRTLNFSYDGLDPDFYQYSDEVRIEAGRGLGYSGFKIDLDFIIENINNQQRFIDFLNSFLSGFLIEIPASFLKHSYRRIRGK